MLVFQTVPLILSVVVVLEQEPEDPAGNETRNTQTTEGPHHLGVLGHWRKRNTKGRTKSVHKKEDGHDERLHVHRSLGVGVLQTGDGSENLRHTNQEVTRSLEGNVDMVWNLFEFGVTGLGEVVTRTSIVDEVLQDTSVDHGGSTEHETPENLGNSSEWSESSDEWVDESLTDWNKHNKGDGVDGLQDIVGQTVELHLTSLGNKVVVHLAVHQPVDRVEGKHLTGVQGSLDLIDKLVVPWESLVRVKRGSGGIVVETLQSNKRALERTRNDLVSDRHLDVVVLTQDKSGYSDGEEAERQKEGSPEIDIVLQLGGCDNGKRADVDHEVEEHENVLDGDVGVLNDSFAGLQNLNGGLGLGHLVGNQRRDVGLDTSGTDTNDDDGDNKAGQRGVLGSDGGKRGDEQDENTNHHDHTEHANGKVLSEESVGDPGTEDRRHVTPKLPKV